MGDGSLGRALPHLLGPPGSRHGPMDLCLRRISLVVEVQHGASLVYLVVAQLQHSVRCVRPLLAEDEAVYHASSFACGIVWLCVGSMLLGFCFLHRVPLSLLSFRR